MIASQKLTTVFKQRQYMPRKFLSPTTLLVVAMFACSSMAQADGHMEKGKELTMSKKKGNCLACHAIADGNLPGTIAPPLIAMQARYPDKAVLRAQIHDARDKNPLTMMPPFGAHGLLSAEEIDLITDYVHSL